MVGAKGKTKKNTFCVVEVPPTLNEVKVRLPFGEAIVTKN